MFGRVPAGAAQAAAAEGTSHEPVNAQGTDTRNPLLVPVFSAEDRRPVDSLADTPQNKRNRNETTFTFEGGLIGAVFLQFKPRKPAPVLWQVLNVELQATTSSISFFNTALINLGVLNASKLLSESVFDPSNRHLWKAPQRSFRTSGSRDRLFIVIEAVISESDGLGMLRRIVRLENAPSH